NFPEVTKLLTHLSDYLELFGMGLFLIPWKTGFFRTLGVFAYMGFHLGIALCMNLGIFPWVDIFAFTLLLPSAFWTFIFRGLKTPESAQGSILIQTNNDFHKTWLKVYKTFFLLPHIPIESQSAMENSEKTWGVITLSPEGEQSLMTGKMAFEKLFQYSPLLGPFYKCFTPLAISVSKGITFLSSSQISKNWKIGPLKTLMGKGLSAFFMVYIIQAAILDFHKETPWFNDLGKYFRLYQHWVMFTTPRDPGSGWVYITGTQQNQDSVDLTQWLFHQKITPQHYTRPSNSRDFYPEDRWRQYFVSMSVVNQDTQRKLPYIPLYLCKTWNATKPIEDPQRLYHVEMGYFFVPTPDPGQKELPPVKRPYWQMNCN
ncbi:MAG: hypothetical protein K2X66_14495, partial [Cyanobacteria bacterium]|nr:hypothetical protein [Cyanobacteriota bacterium]